MSFFIFEYTLPKGYYLKVIDHYEDTDLTRAYLYKGNYFFQKLIDVNDFEKDTPKLEIVRKSIKFLGQLEDQINSKIDVL